MTADIELLPLPEARACTAGTRRDCWVADEMEVYTRANMEPLLAEIAALRAERDRAMGACELISGHLATAEARAERLAEALRRQRGWWLASKGEAVSNAPGGLTRIDPGFIALCDAHVQKIDLALRDHDQEVGNG